MVPRVTPSDKICCKLKSSTVWSISEYEFISSLTFSTRSESGSILAIFHTGLKSSNFYWKMDRSARFYTVLEELISNSNWFDLIVFSHGFWNRLKSGSICAFFLTDMKWLLTAINYHELFKWLSFELWRAIKSDIVLISVRTKGLV